MAQIYEQYWSYTAAFTDLFGPKAVTTLKTCVEFLDSSNKKNFSQEAYEDLQAHPDFSVADLHRPCMTA